MLAKNTPLRRTPTSTPWARSWVQTTTTTVETITIEECDGWLRSFLIEVQLKVPTDTMIMTATSAGIGADPGGDPVTATTAVEAATQVIWGAPDDSPVRKAIDDGDAADEENVKIENTFYEAEDAKSRRPREALDGYKNVVTMATEKFEKDGEEPQFRFKALQNMVV